MGKTRDLFKKIRDTKGTFHAKMGSIKDRNGMDLTETEDIKKRWQEYTEAVRKLNELMFVFIRHSIYQIKSLKSVSHFHCIIIRDLI